MIKFASILVVSVVAYWTLLFLLQRRLTFPAPIATDHGSPAPDTRRIWLNGTQGKTEAWLLPALPTNEPPFAVLLFAHGNGELIDYWASEFDELRNWGLAVLLVEYPGYGRSQGRPSENAMGATFQAAYDWVVENGAVYNNRIVGYGRSLGGGVIAGLSLERQLDAMILESTFTSARPFARRFGAPGFLVRDVFNTLSAVERYDGPLLVVHGVDDRIVPVGHGRKLAEAGGVILQELRCGHNDCPRPWRLVREFLVESEIIPAS